MFDKDKDYVVYHKTDTMPTILVDPIVASESVHLSLERLMELVHLGYAPHYVLDDSTILFGRKEIKDWVKKNLYKKSDGRSIQFNITVNQKSPLINPEDLPIELIGFIDRIFKIDLTGRLDSGVYFLYEEKKLVYIGKSINIKGRVSQHGDKDFSEAYYIPLPEEYIHDTEKALIKAFKPKLNGTYT